MTCQCWNWVMEFSVLATDGDTHWKVVMMWMKQSSIGWRMSLKTMKVSI